MTITEWIDYLEDVRTKYLEGYITAKEYFDAIIAKAVEVELDVDSVEE